MEMEGNDLLGTWRHQAIAWTYVDILSAGTSDIHLRAISQDLTYPSITEISLKIV